MRVDSPEGLDGLERKDVAQVQMAYRKVFSRGYILHFNSWGFAHGSAREDDFLFVISFSLYLSMSRVFSALRALSRPVPRGGARGREGKVPDATRWNFAVENSPHGNALRRENIPKFKRSLGPSRKFAGKSVRGSIMRSKVERSEAAPTGLRLC